MGLHNNDVKISVTESKPEDNNNKPFYDMEWFDFLVDKFVIFLALLLLAFWHHKIGPLLGTLYQFFNSSGNSKQNETRFSYTGIILGKILSELNADRVIVGKIYYRGNSPYELGRLEIVREVVAPGIEPIRKRFEDISLRSLESEFRLLEEQKMISVDKNSAGEHCRRHLTSIGIEYTSTIMIRNLETTIGILSIQHRDSRNGVDVSQLSGERKEKFTQYLDSLVYYLAEDFPKVGNNTDKKDSRNFVVSLVGKLLKAFRS